MSIQSEITRISGNVSDAFTAITNKGVTVPAGSTSDDLADLISQISGGGGGAISIVDTPDSAGGTIRTITAVDISEDTVTAAHLEQGYTAHDAEGNAITGTLSPGGSGLEYETGTYTPASDVAQPTISFANTHTARPFHVIIADVSNTTASNDSALLWSIINQYDAFEIREGACYARSQYLQMANGNASTGGTNVTSLTGTASSSMPFFLSESEFIPYVGSTSRYFRAGRTYKWIAVWAPST